MSKYVIIGNGGAAVGAIEGIRSADREGDITVISLEKHHVYCRPLISYYLEGKTDFERIKYRPDDFYKKNGCTVLYGRRAEKIDSGKKTVTLSDGQVISYDKLCICTGSSPFVPPFEGLDSVENKSGFMTLDDALYIEKKVTEESRVLIVGAGLIGLKCAEGICQKAKSVTVCDLAPRVLSSILDDKCAAFMQEKLEQHGVGFLLGDTAVKFDKNTAFMKSGKQVEFDLLVLAVGVRPNTALVKEAGGNIGRGITVDSRSATSLPDIYAAGDCTETTDVSSGQTKIMALLPNAYMQGKAAGLNMAGRDFEFNNAIPMNSIGFFGLHAMTAGSYFDESQGGEMFEISLENGIKRLFTKDGFLTGFIIIGGSERAGIYTNMIRNRVPICDVDFESMKKNANLFAFGKEYCGKTLGGVI